MGFMKSYKCLDNLCKDMNGIGVTGYIEDMDQKRNGEYYVSGWKTDYLKLKYYRHIRNRIAHENNADEDNMCSEEDTIWIEEFYQRIMNQTDPLALYYKAVRLRPTLKSTAGTKVSQPTQWTPVSPKRRRTTEKLVVYGAMILIAIGLILLILFFIYKFYHF